MAQSETGSMIDTHCHLNFESYDADREAVIERARDLSVERIIIPGINLATSLEAIRLAEAHSGIFVATGIHPNDACDAPDDAIQQLRALSQEASVISIGEIGLDYYWDKTPKSVQKQWFEAQLDLAGSLGLPVIIHNREASEDTLAILENWVTSLAGELRQAPGVLHSFSGDQRIAERALEAGFFLGFTGPITFKKAETLRKVARLTPMDRILVETDGPFLTPVPYRGKRNEPAYIPYIVEALAQVHGVATNEMAQATTENALRLFRLS